MKKFLAVLMTAMLALGLFTGCNQTENNSSSSDVASSENSGDNTASGALKTGLGVVTNVTESTAATDDAEGKAHYSISYAAVAVDADGKIVSCKIDAVNADITFDKTGAMTGDLTASPATKMELGEDYGMVAYGGAKYEWDEQATALEEYAVGKTLEEFKSGAVNESGYAVDADLASTATIYLGELVGAVEAAVNNAEERGAQSGDTLSLAIINSEDSSKNATADEAGKAQLDADIAVVTMNGDTITSCYIDALQVAVGVDATGAITSDLNAEYKTKNALGSDYGMVAYGGAKYEWNEQAAALAEYATGKTVADFKAGACGEDGKAVDADLAAVATIHVSGSVAAVEKAAAAK